MDGVCVDVDRGNKALQSWTAVQEAECVLYGKMHKFIFDQRESTCTNTLIFGKNTESYACKERKVDSDWDFILTFL